MALDRRADRLAWFGAVGQALGAAERDAAQRYLNAVGFAACPIVGVARWGDAKAIADAPDWDPAWWDAEERARGALLEAATARHGRAALLSALTVAARTASERAYACVASAEGVDASLARAAAGAASQACYLAALAAAVESTAAHAFVAKFALFERGRWPLGIVGGRFHVF